MPYTSIGGRTHGYVKPTRRLSDSMNVPARIRDRRAEDALAAGGGTPTGMFKLIGWRRGSAVTVVVAAAGYPGTDVRRDDPILGADARPGETTGPAIGPLSFLVAPRLLAALPDADPNTVSRGEGISLPAEGLIRVSSLADDFYTYDRAAHTLTGRRSGRVVLLSWSSRMFPPPNWTYATRLPASATE